MHEATNKQPNSLGELQSLVLQLQQQNVQKDQLINQLLEQIKLARHQRFGTRSERFSLDQMALVFNEACADTIGTGEGDGIYTQVMEQTLALHDGWTTSHRQ